jgi:mercuric ion transport protein
MSAKRSNLALGASAVSAVAASLCCIGPLVALALGLGGFAGAAFFAKWRPFLLGVTLLLLGLAWYLNYRKPRNGVCSETDACAAEMTSRWNKSILIVATVLVLAAAGFPAWFEMVTGHHPSGMTPSSHKSASELASLHVAIPSMDCPACAQLIQATLRRQPGIEAATVTFQTKAAVVQYDTTRISRERIIFVINQTGFKAESITLQKTQ